MAIDTPSTPIQGLVLPADDLMSTEMHFDTFGDWCAFRSRLHKADEHLNWVAGEWLKFGKENYGEVAFEALKAIVGDETGKRTSALGQALRVAEAFPAGTRVPEVSWTTHRAVVGLPEEERRPLLEEARDEGLTTREVQDRVRERKQRPAPTVAPEPVAEPVAAVVVDVMPEIIEPAPADAAEAWLLIADMATFIRDRVLTKIVMANGVPTRHDRHCGATAERPACAEKCSVARGLITRSELA